MKYIGMPMAMWAVFAKSFEKQLTEVFGYDAKTAKAIRKTAKLKYKEIIAKLPEFEKGDRFSMNIIGCAMLGAFVLCMPRRPDTESLTVYYENAQMTPLMKWFCRRSGKKQVYRKGHCRHESHRRPEGGLTATPTRGIWTFTSIPTAAVMRGALRSAASAR
ncbi:MAG: hypothetical protein ACLTZH_02855 [Subdoligranulum sp.]